MWVHTSFKITLKNVLSNTITGFVQWRSSVSFKPLEVCLALYTYVFGKF